MGDFLTGLGTGGFGLLAGGLGRLFAEGVSIFKARSEQKHELAMTELQLRIDKGRADQALDLVHAQGAIADSAVQLKAWSDAIHDQGQNSGVGWADAVSKTVRPFLTYWWCLLLYTVDKGFLIALSWGEPLQVMEPIILSEFDKQIVASIFAFWFVDRAIKWGR